MIENIGTCSNPNPPVLLQQGIDPLQMQIAVNRNVTESFRVRTDRGYLKHIDMFPFDNSTATLRQNLPVTLNLGGQNLVENSNSGIWSILSQFGKDYRWQIRSKFNSGQIGFLNINGNDPKAPAVADQTMQVILKYSTPAHELFLKNNKLKYGQGLKRRSYTSVIPVTAVAGVTTVLTEELPRNNGRIIGVALSLNSDINDAVLHPNLELANAFVTLNIDGVAIIENVSSIYYSYQNGRDYYYQPCCINAGGTMELNVTQTTVNTTEFYMNVTFYFDN
jgi:hypothetical protein